MTDLIPQKLRKTKKSETLEVRLPYETKQAFLTACREDGTTASEVVRGTIDDYLDARERPSPQTETGRLLDMIPQPIRKKRYLFAGAGVLAAGLAVALPSAAGPDMRAAFDRLDANRDGVLSADEFEGAKSGAEKKVVMIERRTQDGGRGQGKRAAVCSRSGRDGEIAFAFWLPDDFKPSDAKSSGDKASGDTGKDRAVMIEKHEVRIRKDDGSQPQIVTEDFRKSEFDRFDANKDGKVTYDEYQSVQTAMLTSGFHLLDASHDGSLSETEYAKIGSPMVIKADADGAAEADVDVQIAHKPAVDAKSLKTRFRKLDKNGDGKLSLEEYLP